jgi:ParB family transcriptional regulator, chromosome partitioning protein
MSTESRKALQAKGKTDLFFFDPEDIVLVEDEKAVLYDERVKAPINEAMVLNIMYAPDGATPQGVLKPILGRRNPETGKVECIDGRTRTRANREANKRLKKAGLPVTRIPVMLKRADDSRMMAMLISANEHHTEDLPLNRARKAQRYIDLGHDSKEVAQILGMSEATVKNLLRLLEAPAAVRNALDAGKISASDAYKLSREEPAEAKKKVAELIEQAPRTPGKKRSKNAKKARQVMGKPEPEAAAEPEAAPSKKSTKKLEDAVAEAIAVWIEATWTEGKWNGAPSDIPVLIRKGDWREHRASSK